MNIKKIEWRSAHELRRKQLCGNFLLCIGLKSDTPSIRTDREKSNSMGYRWNLCEQGKYHQYLLYGAKIRPATITPVVLCGLINFGYFAELLAFLDIAYESPRDTPAKGFFFPQVNNCETLYLSYRQVEQGFIMRYLSGERDNEFSALCHFIRQQEPYVLTRYLIENYKSYDKINELSERYGLSYSYFRKKTQLYFGDTAKSKIQAWRLATTTLELLESPENITRVAMNNGFASSSHICQVILSSMGMTPSSVRKANERL